MSEQEIKDYLSQPLIVIHDPTPEYKRQQWIQDMKDIQEISATTAKIAILMAESKNRKGSLDGYNWFEKLWIRLLNL